MKREDTPTTRIEFENFKSNVCHRLKFMGDMAFLREYLTNGDIRTYYDEKSYAECFYLLAMVDYVSRIHNIPYCSDFNDLRQYTLDETIYPLDVLLTAISLKDETIKEKAYKSAISEFLRHNIAEAEIRTVI